ncbi:MAG: hypothetical protein Q8P31_02455 [Bacillota bacterium]|nr:hypothetical protein [Bacillota bacterium]
MGEVEATHYCFILLRELIHGGGAERPQDFEHITHLAITLMINRLQDTFGAELSPFEVIGDPKDLRTAEALAAERKKGADAGIDGYINFFDDGSGKAKTIIVQV